MATDVSVRIGVDGEKEFRSALAAVNSQIKNLDSESKLLVSSLSGMDNAEQAAAEKSDILGKTIDATKQKITIIASEYERAKSKLAELDNELSAAKSEFGENSDAALKAENAYNRQSKAVNDLGTKLNGAKSDLNGLESSMRDLGGAADDSASDLDNLGNALEDVGTKGSGVKGTLSGVTQSIVAGGIGGAVSKLVDGIKNLVESTAEFNKIQSTLAVSSQASGYSAAETASSYERLYAIIGDDQAAATALANLQALGLSQSDLTELIDGAIGSWSKYGDSIPIDSLSEAINETIQTGTVTGSFADVLNWAGQSEDDFNEKLQSVQDPAQRAQMVLQELSNQGLVKLADSYRNTNSEIVGMNTANLQFQKSLGTIGTALTPILALGTSVFAGLLSGVMELANNVKTFLQPLIDSVSQTFAGIKTAFESTFGSDAGSKISGFFSTLATVIVSVPFAVLLTVFDAIGQGIQKLISYIGSLVGFFTTTVPSAVEAVKNKFTEIITKLSEVSQNITAFIKSAGQNVVNFFMETIPNGINNSLQWFAKLPSEIGAKLAEVLTKVSEWAGNILERFSDSGNNILLKISEIFGQVPVKVAEILALAITKVVEWGSGMVSSVRAGLSLVVDAVTSKLSGIPLTVKSIGGDIVRGLWNGINDKAGWIKNKILSWCGSIKKAMVDFFKIGSPSKLMENEIGMWLPLGLAKGVDKTAGKSLKTIQGFAGSVLNAMQPSNISAMGAMFVPRPGVSTDDIYRAAEGIVNASSVMQPGREEVANKIIIPVNLDGRQIAEAIYNPLKSVSKQRGDSLA